MTDKLDITTLETPDEIDEIPWEKYCTSERYPSMVTQIYSSSTGRTDSVRQRELSRICKLSGYCRTIRLANSMGELYMKRV